ncbi:MAG: hypothetical protein KCHDKBKB_00803 [Elusimicrobia bacterium]|nr:hypothetical protein [Elusimicrobiota bacterium]
MVSESELTGRCSWGESNLAVDDGCGSVAGSRHQHQRILVDGDVAVWIGVVGQYVNVDGCGDIGLGHIVIGDWWRVCNWSIRSHNLHVVISH